MTIQRTFEVERQVEVLRQFLESEEVRNRPPGSQRAMDDLIRRLLEDDDVNTAFALWVLMSLRCAGESGRAAQSLLQVLAQVDVKTVIRTLVATNRVN